MIQVVPVTLSCSVDVPDPVPGPAGPAGPAGAPAPPPPTFAWDRTYTDPAGYSRLVPAGYNGGLNDSTGNTPIKIQPPTSGVGRCEIFSSFSLVVFNPNDSPVKVRCALGVGSVITGAKPMYPYLGVNHGRADLDALAAVVIPSGGQIQIGGFRLDIVDNALESDQPIPGWPQWSMANGSRGVPPFIVVQFIGDPLLPVTVQAVQAVGWVR